MDCPRTNMVLTEQVTIGKRHPSGEQEGEWTQEKCLSCGLQSLVLGDVLSRFSLINRSGSRSVLWYTPCLAKMDSSKEDYGRLVGLLASLADLSWTPVVGGSLLVPCSLPGPPVVKYLVQMITMVPGPGGVVSVSVSSKILIGIWVVQVHVLVETYQLVYLRFCILL